MSTVSDGLTDLLSRLIEGRRSSVDATRNFQTIALSLREREAARLRAKGVPNDPRLKKLDLQLRRAPQVLDALEAERERLLRKPAAPLEPDSAILEGRIADTRLKAISGLKVRLVARDGVAIEGMGDADLDDSGAYSIRLGPDQLKAIQEQHRGTVFVAVISRGEKVVHRETSGLKVAPGTRVSKNVTLDRLKLAGVDLRSPAGPSAPRRARRAAPTPQAIRPEDSKPRPKKKNAPATEKGLDAPATAPRARNPDARRRSAPGGGPRDPQTGHRGPGRGLLHSSWDSARSPGLA